MTQEHPHRLRLPECLTGPRLVVALDPRPTEPRDERPEPSDDERLTTLVTVLEVMVQEGLRTFSLQISPAGREGIVPALDADPQPVTEDAAAESSPDVGAESDAASPDDLALLDQLRGIFTDRAWFGVHGVADAEQMHRALAVAPAFVLANNDDESVLRVGLDSGVVTLPAALTPNEVHRAWLLGAPAVQVLPADLMASSYPAALRELLPEVPVIARGGLGAWSVGRWFEGGAMACCADTALLGDALGPGANLGQFRDRCRSYLDVVPHPRLTPTRPASD